MCRELEKKDLISPKTTRYGRYHIANEKAYCGFSCGDKLEEIQQVLDEVIDFSHYNPEFAASMLDKIDALVKNARAKLK